MSFIQMKQVLSKIQSASQSLVDAYEDLHEEVPDLAVKHCLLAAITQEQSLINCLKEYVKSAPEKVLKCWFQSPGIRQLKEAVALVEMAQINNRDDVSTLVLHCDGVFLAVYRNLASSSMSRDVNEVFLHLEVVRQQHGRDRTWRSHRIRRAWT